MAFSSQAVFTHPLHLSTRQAGMLRIVDSWVEEIGA